MRPFKPSRLVLSPLLHDQHKFSLPPLRKSMASASFTASCFEREVILSLLKFPETTGVRRKAREDEWEKGSNGFVEKMEMMNRRKWKKSWWRGGDGLYGSRWHTDGF